MSDALKPSAALLSKLGSIVAHAEELLSPKGHPVDRNALQTLVDDQEVRTWIKQMGPLLPLKR